MHAHMHSLTVTCLMTYLVEHYSALLTKTESHDQLKIYPIQTQPTIQCVRTSLIASFASPAGKKTMSLKVWLGNYQIREEYRRPKTMCCNIKRFTLLIGILLLMVILLVK